MPVWFGLDSSALAHTSGLIMFMHAALEQEPLPNVVDPSDMDLGDALAVDGNGVPNTWSPTFKQLSSATGSGRKQSERP